MSLRTRGWPSRWIRSRSGIVGTGALRAQIDDFRVDELYDPAFAGEGEHLYVQIEKRDLTTLRIRDFLAKAFRVRRIDVSYSGMKDRRAVATQWFSIRTPLSRLAQPLSGMRILKSERHVRKLRRGDHSGNRFCITIRDVSDLAPDFASAFAVVPFPNYFGPQRFGRSGGNVEAALAWAENDQPETTRFTRSLYISTLRSLVFNDVLSLRIEQQNWKQPQVGDNVGDGFPTGPLWGRGYPCTTGAPRESEDAIAAKYPKAIHALEWVGLSQERRPLAVVPDDAQVQHNGSNLDVQFTLPRGSYATSALREWFDLSGA